MKRRNRVNFEEILAEVTQANVNRLVDRAQLANRLAKTLKGTARASAYKVKHDALMALACRNITPLDTRR